MKHRLIGLALLALGCVTGATQTRAADEPMDKAIRQFVDSYAAHSPASRQIARWRIAACPETYGLQPDIAAAVTKRVKEVAALVGAGPAPKDPCDMNIRILYTDSPQKMLDQIREQSPSDLGYHNSSQVRKLATVHHPIQAWYVTGTMDNNGATYRDDNNASIRGCGLAQIQGCRSAAKGTLIGSGHASVFLGVTIVIDAKAGFAIGEIADYVAMVALSQTTSFDGCRDLPSITNLLSLGCDVEKKSAVLTPNDIAYLRALYQMELQASSVSQKNALKIGMKQILAETRP